ncbi:copper amine oxidase N-terminal domain-containing protein [Bacillus litorisediminis]|uniref:copper amine oxidase N-terminal domain-containing protein n=1 Tax=Bacillus litorisediminis TaxID=2922713 RepID=UPI001FAFA5A2|nr:copper amine oxidase N-terminal domain-containing protein [Bacillus litorisediminis]
MKIKTIAGVLVGLSIFSTGVYAGTVIEQYKTPRGNYAVVEQEEIHKNRIGITVNGQEISKDTWYSDGVTYAPIRDVAELLGAEVVYNSSTWSADITTNTEAKPTEPKEETENDNSEEIAEIDDIDELMDYLTEEYGTLETEIGTTTFAFTYIENDSELFPEDYWIQVEYDVGNESVFYDVKYSNKYDDETKAAVKEQLKEHQRKIAEDSIAALPEKKLEGGYFDSWYRYPSLRVDLITRRYYSWKNHDGDYLDGYDDAKITEFQWDDSIDDEL